MKMQELIELIEARMQEDDMTCQELANEAGVGCAYLYRVLSGEQTPTLRWIEKVAETLGIEITFKITP